MIKGGTGGANTQSGAYFEQITKGIAPGIPLHNHDLRFYYEEYTGECYSLSFVKHELFPGEFIPASRKERAEAFEGRFLMSKALCPDEAYLDRESSTLTIFEKKLQNCKGSVDEKIQTSGFKIQQYKKIAKKLDIENVYYIYILGDFFKHPYYADVLEYIKSIPNCDYYFANVGM